jgi:hypothetical protein
MQGEPDKRASNEEEAESRAYRRIVDALERDDIGELAAALGQSPNRRGTRRTATTAEA